MSKKTIIASAMGLAMAGGLALAQTGTPPSQPGTVHRGHHHAVKSVGHDRHFAVIDQRRSYDHPAGSRRHDGSAIWRYRDNGFHRDYRHRPHRTGTTGTGTSGTTGTGTTGASGTSATGTNPSMGTNDATGTTSGRRAARTDRG